MRELLGGNEVKVGLSLVLLTVSIVLLFVPVADGASGLRVMFFLLTALVVFDLVRSIQEDKRVRDIQQALDPSPPPSHVLDFEDADQM
jgi:hypothetical protein